MRKSCGSDLWRCLCVSPEDNNDQTALMVFNLKVTDDRYASRDPRNQEIKDLLIQAQTKK
jgi:hypothetical protein